MQSNHINRVPHILFLYWVIKIAATTLGETGADMFSMTFNFGYSSTIFIFMTLFSIFLGIKIFLKRYEPITYWLTFTSSAIVGTAISDFIDRTLGLGYALGSAILITLLLIVLGIWYIKEKSLSVEEISTPTAELFYWIAFLIANTLGTAAGDFVADDLELGFMLSAFLFTGSLVITTVLHYKTKISSIVLFWFAFVLTRPFGATFGDFLTKSTDKGGLELGTIGASSFFAVILIFALIKEVKIEKERKF